MAPDKYEGLTDEEREALEEADREEEEARLAEEAEDAEEDDEEGDDDTESESDEEEGDEPEDDDKDDNSDSEDDGEEEAAGEEGEQDATEQEEAEEERQPNPLISAEFTEEESERLSAIDGERDQLDTQFDDGDIDAKEYREKSKALDKEQRELERKKDKAELAREMQENQARQAWRDTVEDFVTENAEYKSSKFLWNALDAAVKEVASDEANSSLTGKQILKKADEMVRADIPNAFASKDSGENTDEGEGKSKTKKASKKPKDVPPTLGNVPAAEQTETEGNSKFRRLDRLMDKDPVKYEQELAKLSEQELAEYEATG